MSFLKKIFDGMDFDHTPKSDVEDVDYQEVRPEPACDKETRKREVFKVSMEKAKPLSEKDPILGLAHSLLWAEGALWADSHSKSSFPSTAGYNEAARNKVNELIKKSCPKDELDPLLSSILYLAFVSGANWATEHPAVCQS